MKEFLKSNWGWLLVIILILGFVVYQQFELKEKYELLDYSDSLHKIDSVRYEKIALEFKTQEQINNDLKKSNINLSELLDKANEEVRLTSQLVLKYKNQYFSRRDTIPVFQVISDTIRVPVGQDTVGFDAENSLFKVKGQTNLYPYKGYWVNIEGKPFSIDFVVSEDRNGIFKTYIDTKNPDLELIDVRTRFIKEGSTLGFWENFSGFAGTSVTNKDASIDLNILYKKVGIRGVVGYDYQSYTIDKNNLKYGGGLVLKLF